MINQYFGFNSFTDTNEQDLYQDLVDEDIQIHGMDVYYIPQMFVNLDKIFGEDPLVFFSKYYTIEMYFNTPENFDGDITINKFAGLTNFLQTNFIVSSRRYTEVVSESIVEGMNPNQAVRPLEGDLLYMPMTRDFWDITKVDHIKPKVFQLGKVMMCKLDVEKHVYSSERFSTGNTELDRLQTAFSHDTVIPATDGVADNSTLHTEALPKIDTSEGNPFIDGNF